MAVNLMLSRPGAYTREGFIVGNPEAVKNDFAPGGAYGAADLTMEKAAIRLLSIATEEAIDIIQVSDGETTGTANGVATRVPAPTSGIAAYACLIHPATVAVYVKLA